MSFLRILPVRLSVGAVVFVAIVSQIGLNRGHAEEPRYRSTLPGSNRSIPSSRRIDKNIRPVNARQDEQETNVSSAPTGVESSKVAKAPAAQEQAEWKHTDFQAPPAMIALQSMDSTPIDMAGAFALIGVQNPDFLAAQQHVIEADALRQIAAVQLLPTINLGTSFDSHAGVLQQSNGHMLTVNRQSLFVGAGANAIAAGTVNIPGVVWNLNASDAYFNALIARQVQARSEVHVTTINNVVQLQVATAYLELVRAYARRSILWQSRHEFAEVEKITAAFAEAGQGRAADENRAASELLTRDSEVIDAEGKIVSASARLATLVGLDTATRLLPVDRWAVPHSIIPEPMPLQELLAVAVLRRPELEEQRIEFGRTLLALRAAKLLPFSPNVFLGLSAGAFGGGSDLATQPVGTTAFASGQERFGNFQSRGDLDAMVYWSLQNLGVGNKALVDISGSRVRQSQWQQMIVLDKVRSEVAAAFVRVHVRYRQLTSAEQAILESETAWREDLNRARGNEGLPIEVLNSLRLLLRSRLALLNTITSYNIAQFELYFAMGQPQSELLVRPVDEASPANELPPSPPEK